MNNNNSSDLSFVNACNASSSPGIFYMETAPTLPSVYLQGTAGIVYTLLSILTVGGNALVFLTVFHYMRTITVTNIFIGNLAITDFFIGLFCIPIVLITDYLMSYWPFGLVLCKLTSFVQSVFVVCTVYTLIAMSVDRYLAIIHPLKPKLTHRNCYRLIVCLWTFSIVFSSPTLFEMHIRHVCFERDRKEYIQTTCQPNGLPILTQTIYNIATLIIIYLIPLIVLSIVYIRLGWQLNKSRAPGEAHTERDARIKKSKKKVFKMCFAVVFMFGICWLPMLLYNSLRPYIEQIFNEKYVPHIYFTFHLMSMSNSCVNPFIYGIMSSRFRAGYLHYWNCLITCCGFVNDQWKAKDQNLNETVILSASFRPARRDYHSSLTNIHSDIERPSTISLQPMIPLLSVQRN